MYKLFVLSKWNENKMRRALITQMKTTLKTNSIFIHDSNKITNSESIKTKIEMTKVNKVDIYYNL